MFQRSCTQRENLIIIIITTHKKRYISPEERQKVIDELRLVPEKTWVFLKIIDELMLIFKKIHIP